MDKEDPTVPATLPLHPSLGLPALASLRAQVPGHMERSLSADIREEREELREAAEQTLNTIIDINLDCTVKWASPSWMDVVGTLPESIVGSPISDLIVSENKSVFTDVLDSMKTDDSRSHRVRFAVKLGPLSKLLPPRDLETSDEADRFVQEQVMDLEGQGIMVYDSASGGESHTMWMLRPWIAPREIKIDLPGVIVDSLGSGAEVLASYLTQLAEAGVEVPENCPPPPAVLCRICERHISPWWFEKHTDLCLQEHRAEMDVQMAQENLTEHRHAIVKVLDVLEARQSRPPAGEPITLPVAEYKGLPIGPPPSTQSSPGTSSARSGDRSGGMGHVRTRSFAVRRPQARIVELLVDLCDTAIEISTPALKDPVSNIPGGIRSHSPQSDSRISQVLQWQSPSTNTLEQEQGLALLCADTERAAKAKVEAVFRHRKIIEYAERIRIEFSVLVQDCIDEAIKKAARIAAGRLSDSTDYEEDFEGPTYDENGSDHDHGGDDGNDARTHVVREGGDEESEKEVSTFGESEDIAHPTGAAPEPGDSGNYYGGYQDVPAAGPPRTGEYGPQGVESVEGTSALVAALQGVSLRGDGQVSSRSRPVSVIEGIRPGTGSPRDYRSIRSSGGNIAVQCGSGSGLPGSRSRRQSIMAESDAGDSDSSLRSSSVASRHPTRTDSPISDFGDLRRAANARQHHRRSLILPGTASPGRQESPSRPPQPSSPLRIHKPPRGFPFSQEALVSPEASPMLPGSELSSPAPMTLHQHQHQHQHSPHHSQQQSLQHPHHRRQSSAAMSEFVMRAPPSPRLGAHSVPTQSRPAQPSIKDFEIIKPISKGAFGSVYLSKKKTTGEYFAIKVLKKADMVAKNQVGNVKAERAIMMWQGESEFVAKLYWTFSSKDYLYLVMEYLNGGDCASLIKVLGGLPEDWAKKYLGEVVLGVEHLHSRGIIHRDLKPDNLLIDQKGHLKLTDFGLSRMGLVGRQKRALRSDNAEPVPDLLKQGPFARSASMASSRSTSMDLHGQGPYSQSPGVTPQITPDPAAALSQPSYFSLGPSSHEPRRQSTHRSDSGGSESLTRMFNTFGGFSMNDTESVASQASQSSVQHGQQQQQHNNKQSHPKSPVFVDDADALSSYPHGSFPDLAPYGQSRHSSSDLQMRGTPPNSSSMMPPPMALFDPEDTNRRFVGTPDYLAPETIKGDKQDETSDWWSVGCILYEFLYGIPPFNAEMAELVFENILARRMQWPDVDVGDGDGEDGEPVSVEAKDLINKLLCMDPQQRLGANREEKFASGGEEIRSHPWFEGINWETLLQDEAQFVPQPENLEDTEYFDSRGAVLQSFAEEVEDQASSPLSAAGSEYPDRPHDALSRVRSQVNSIKRGLMPLHIPPHVRDLKSRRLSEPVASDDFGNFSFKNLPVLEKANKDVIQKLRAEALASQNKGGGGAGSGNGSKSGSGSSTLNPGPGPGIYSQSPQLFQQSEQSQPPQQAQGAQHHPPATQRTPQQHSQTSSSSAGTPSSLTSLDGSPLMAGANPNPANPLQRAISSAKSANRPQSPSGLSHANSSPSRISQPSSPLLVSFVAGPGIEGRRKASSNSSSLSQHDIPKVPPSLQKAATSVSAATSGSPSTSSSPVRPRHSTSSAIPSLARLAPLSLSLSPQKTVSTPRHGSGSITTTAGGGGGGRSRSLTVGSQSQDGSPVGSEALASSHRSRRSQVFDLSPSSSDNEGEKHNALLRVQRRRQGSRRLSQINLDTGPSFRPLDVLICEDHPVSRMVIEKLLEKLRCRTISVPNGSEAVRYSMSDIKFDIILLEYKLPQINGGDVARMVRETKNANSHTPIVAITAYLKELQAPHYFDSLIEKPISSSKLSEVLRALCHWCPESPRRGPSLYPSPSKQQVQHQARQPHQPHQHSQHHPATAPGMRHSSSPRPTDSPTSSSSVYANRPGSSLLLSSREDSVSSSTLGDSESVVTDDIPLLVNRRATGDWEDGGLGIKDDDNQPRQPVTAPPSVPNPLGQTSAPAHLEHMPTSKPHRLIESSRAKRELTEKRSPENTDSADDEDDELCQGMASGAARGSGCGSGGGNDKPFRSKAALPSSKLGIEMMRANSHDSATTEPGSALEFGKHSAATQEIESSALQSPASYSTTPPLDIPGDHRADSAVSDGDVTETPRPASRNAHILSDQQQLTPRLSHKHGDPVGNFG